MYTEYNRNMSTGNTCSKSTDTVYQPATNIRADGLTDTADGTDFNMHTAAKDMSGSRNMMPIPSGTTTGRASVANSQVPQSGDVANMRTTGSNSISFTPETVTNPDFLPAYLSKFIGKWIRADFLIGNGIEQRVGILHDVGASYIIMQAIEPATLVVCDLFALKFVTIIMDDEYGRLMLV